MIARRIALAASILILALLTACSGSGGGPLPHPAVTAVSELLEFRRTDVRDPAAYTPYFEDAALAEALAAPGEEPTGTPRVPPFHPPYLSAESTSTVGVAVIWEPDDDFPDWPPVTVFQTQLTDGRWVVTDALQTTIAPEPLTSEAD